MKRFSDPTNDDVVAHLIEKAFDNPSSREKLPEAVSEEILCQILSRKPVRHTIPIPSGRSRLVWTRVAAAAALLLMTFMASYYLFLSGVQDRKEMVEKTDAVPDRREDVEPGGYFAFLTLADETIVALDRTEPGIVARQSGADILKTASGELQYAVVEDAAEVEMTPEYNILTTPRGGQYQMALSDGSLVWLNAGSTLRFPTVFFGGERRVVLSGEAYFEIAHQPGKPFIVHVDSHQSATAGLEIEVLGTHFNIMAYGDEKTLATTLIEGGIRVKELSQPSDYIELHPGQQLRLASSGAVSIHKVDPADYVAWKEGYFIFDNEHIEDIMRRLARWYDVEYQIANELKYSHFSAMVSRFENISKVLEKFELTGVIAFEISSGHIVVKPI